MEFNHSKHNLCMIREICYDSLTVSCSPLCLYSRLLSINKPDGFDTVMFSVCTFITTWLCNHNLSFPFTPFSCYHHPSYKLVQYSYMPTLTSECHFIQQPSKNYFETIQETSLPSPNGCRDWGLPIQLPTEHHKTTAGFIQKLKIGQKYKTIKILYFWILNKWFLHRKFQIAKDKELWVFLKTVSHFLEHVTIQFYKGNYDVIQKTAENAVFIQV